MLFLSPLTLTGLLLVGLPLVIHLLVRRRARRLDFPSLAFLRETPSFKLYPRRIRQPLLLALRAAAIILLVMGLARPLLTLHGQQTAPVRFILLDASLSMRTRGRAEAAREQARAIINKLARGERAAIIAFSSEAKPLAEASSDRSKLLEAVEGYQPSGGAANFRAAFREVNAELGREAQAVGEADIISDFQEAGLEGWDELRASGAAGLRIVTYPVGSEIERNAFLIDEDVRRTERGIELSATEIVSDADGRSGARRTWMIGAGEGTGNGIEWRTESNGQLTGSMKVLEPDDFDADDERFFAFSAPREARVLLIEDQGDAAVFLRAAFEAAGADKKSLKLDRLRELPGSVATLSPYSLVVLTLHGAPREDEVKALAEYARAGGILWLFLARDVDTEAWNALAQKESALPFERLARLSGRVLTLGSVDADAPQLSLLDENALSALSAVRVSNAYALAPRSSAETLMRWNVGSAACLSAHVGEGSIMLLATSPERASSGMGSSPAFPALASAILRFASAMRAPLSKTIGEAVRLDVAPQTNVKITNREGRVTETKARELIRQPLTYISEPGVYRLEFSGVEKFVAFNAPDTESERTLATEGHLKRFFSVEKAGGTVAASEGKRLEAAEQNGSTWRFFLAAAFLLMIAELLQAMRERQVAGARNKL